MMKTYLFEDGKELQFKSLGHALKYNTRIVMNKKDFKIWLINHDYTVKTLSEAFGITEKTIYNYQSTRFPKWFILALKGLEN